MSVGPPERLAEDLLAELGMNAPEDIDVDAVAFRCGALVTYSPLSGCDGRILGSNRSAVITVNQDAPRRRQRFTAAHETAHWLYDKGKVEGACTEEKITRAWGRTNGRESRANKFAAELLLPRSMVEPILSTAQPDLDMARSLSDHFDVSLTAAVIRMLNLSRWPSMVVCTSSRGRQWFARNDLVPETLWPVEQVQAGSELHKLARRAGNSRGELVAADLWTNHHDAHDFELREDSIMITDDLALTIISWPDEEQIVALMDDG